MSSRVSGLPSEDNNQLLDPELVQKIVDELKSQGTFDQFRKDCMAEVDTKPGYQNLRQRVCHSLNKFLDRQQWKPTQNKNQLRNQLRKHIEDSGIMENGVRRIVDQVVNPKILSVIEPEVEYVMYNILGVEKPSNNSGDMTNGNDEKASNVSSEDIEMRSVHDPSDEDDRKKKMEVEEDSPSSSPNMAGQISPLTPERKLKGNISPLTPPPLPNPGSPHTPPLPPLPPTPMYMPPPPQLSDFQPPPPPPPPPLPAGSVMSPVSDTELADLSPPEDSPETPSSESGLLSPPPPPPPPLPPTSPPTKRPPSPLTSPIGSSPDIRTTPLPAGHSDISDTDLPCASSEEKSSDVDIEDLEKAREAILAKMAAEASLSKDDDSDEGEIHTEEDDDERGAKKESESDMSPISDDSGGGQAGKKNDDHDDESKKWETKTDKTSSDEDDSKPQQPTTNNVRRDATSSSSKASETLPKTEEESSNKEKSKEDSDRQHQNRHRSSRHKSSDEKRSEKRSSSTSSSSSSSSKDKHKEKSMKDLKKMEKIEQKVNKAFTLKSDKFKDIDMFAPKAPKPKPPLHRPPSSASNSSSGASPLPSFGNKSPLPSFGAAKSPLSWGSKTPPTFGSPSSSTCGTKSPLSPKNNVQSKTSVPVVKTTSASRKQIDSTPCKSGKESLQKSSKELPSGHEKFSATIMERTKVYPELPVSKSGADKVKQHENDFADSKRRLEEARARRIKEQQKEEHLRKERKKLEKRHDKISRASKTDSDSDDIDWESKSRRSSSSSCEFRSNRSRSNSVREESEPFHGFLSKGLDSQETKSSMLKKIIQEDEESLETDENIIDDSETISIKGIPNPESVAALLKKNFGGNPRVIHPPPSWLEHKLKEWCIPLQDVGIMTFAKPSSDRKSKWKFLTEEKFTLKRKLVTVDGTGCQDTTTKPKRAKVKRGVGDEAAVCQLERGMNAIHSDKPSFWISNPFYGFETSDLLPPSLEPKSSFLQPDLWTQEMKTIFFDSNKDSLKTFSTDLYDECDEDLSTKHALNLIIKPNFDHDYSEHDLPPSPSSLDSDDKGSSSPSSSKENMEEHTLRRKSKFVSNKNVIEKSVIPRTRRNVPVLKKVAS